MKKEPLKESTQRYNDQSSSKKFLDWLYVQHITQRDLSNPPAGSRILIAKSAVDDELLDVMGISSGNPIGKYFGYSVEIMPDFRLEKVKVRSE